MRRLLYSSLAKLTRFQPGDSVTIFKTITKADVEKFIELSGDRNPIHMTRGRNLGIVHGAYLNSLVSGIMGSDLPGPGSIVVSQTLNFPNKCYVNDELDITVAMLQDRKIINVKFQCRVIHSDKTVLYGEARLLRKKQD